MTRSEYAKTRRVPAPPWLVNLPKGTSVHGAVSLYHLLWAQTNREYTLQIVFGKYKPMAKTFEAHAEILSKTIFPGLTPREVLEQHTVFGFFSRCMNDQVADTWAAELASERSAAASVQRFLTLAKGQCIKREHWYCPKCVEEDRELLGYSTWRYIHQIYGLDLCPTHTVPLVAFCGNCAVPYDRGTHFRLPGDVCRHCGCIAPLEGAKPSRGMEELALHCGELANGTLPWLRPNGWAQWIRTFIASTGGDIQQAAEIVERELERSWQRPAPLGLDRATIQLELRLLGRSFNAVSRIAIYGATQRLGQTDSVVALIDEDQLRLEEQLSLHNLPVGLSSQLLEFRPLASTVSKVGTSVDALRSALRDLPDDLKLKVTSRRWRTAEKTSSELFSVSELRAKYRRRIMSVLDTVPNATRTVLWKKQPVPMMWLTKHDRKWLDATRPQKILRGDAAFGASKAGQKSSR